LSPRRGSVARLCRQHAAAELLVSTTKIPTTRRRAVIDDCERAGGSVRQLSLDVHALTADRLGRAVPALE
jgi:hypothetical protein